MNDQERITELESRVAFQEDTLDTLNEIVSRQELEIEQLKRMIKVMNQRMKSLSNDSPTSSPDDEPPPPHY
ncbi:SlyX family protein [Neptuniibacter sp.]|uniref:SlyX family protein n=1 Tax=Neptuniibacter sp. TaxID=1962643 RepID=UPI0026225758|nr:SlyX family protein [Neptuniibacter sp.]MCP4598411.1 SlyX family protein [Neptuniibacter sp.]